LRQFFAAYHDPVVGLEKGRDMLRRWLFGVCCLLSAASVLAAAQPRSGVTGTLSQAPACPGPQRVDQEACVAPVGGAKVQLLRSEGEVAASAVSAADGSFTLYASPGRYRLRAEVEGLYPRCEDIAVTIRKGRMARAELRCDSGMR
jgi:hypothetical protein